MREASFEASLFLYTAGKEKAGKAITFLI